MKKLIYLSVFISVIFFACEKEINLGIEQETPVNPEDLFEQNEYNTDLRDFALAVSNAMNNSKDFRKLVKAEALAKLDGDYDVLLNHIMKKTVKVDNATNGLRSETSYSVEDLLNDYYVSSDASGLRAASTSTISALSAKYPDLQVAVPVHADKLNENTTPTVTFIPSDYKDGVTKTLLGYDLNGNQVEIDAINAPNEPVVVIGLNERINRCPVMPGVKPSAPANLTAMQTTDGIQLSWTQDYQIYQYIDKPANAPTGYYIYRKSPQNSTFELIDTNYGASNTVYWDSWIEAGTSYAYYVVAYNEQGVSPQSNVISVTSAAAPAALASFEALQSTNQQVELRWTIADPNYQSIKLYRQEVGKPGDYQLYQTFGKNIYHYFDNNVQSGKKYKYQVQTASGSGKSNPKYDFIQVPYRNPAFNSAVCIKKMHSNSDCEGWLKGAPEFVIKVLGTRADGSSVELQTAHFDFDGSIFGWDETQYKNIFILDWKAKTWFETLTFYVEEKDNYSTSEVTLNASANYKVDDKLTLTASAGIKTQINKGDEIGYGYFDYFDPIDKVMVFPRSDVKITFGQ